MGAHKGYNFREGGDSSEWLVVMDVGTLYIGTNTDSCVCNSWDCPAGDSHTGWFSTMKHSRTGHSPAEHSTRHLRMFLLFLYHFL